MASPKSDGGGARAAAALRTFDADGYCRRAATLAFTGDARTVARSAAGGGAWGGAAAGGGCAQCSGELRVLLAGSSSKAGTFILPGGGIDEGETAEAAALREAHEEAGIVAAAAGGGCPRRCSEPPIWPLATVTNHAKSTRTRLFALRVGALAADAAGSYEDAGRRPRAWETLPRAAALLAAQPAQAAYLHAALAALDWAVPLSAGAGAGAGAGCAAEPHAGVPHLDVGPPER